MKKLAFTFALLLVATVTHAQSSATSTSAPSSNLPGPSATVSTPKLAEADQLKLQLMAAKRALLLAQYQELKHQFDAQAAELDSKFQTQTHDLMAAIDDAYAKLDLKKEEFTFDVETATFKPVEKNNPAVQPPPPAPTK